MKTETPRQLAERVAWSVIGNHVEPVLRGRLIDDIEAALNAERERCAKIAETPYSDEVEAFGGDEPSVVGKKIAAAIRGKD